VLRVEARQDVLELGGGVSLSLWSELVLTRLDGGATGSAEAARAGPPGTREARLGHGVVEVRVAPEAVQPEWLSMLLRSNRIVRVDNWGPFLQGCVSVHELAPLLVERPEWASGTALGRAPGAGLAATQHLAGAVSAATARASRSRALVSLSLFGGGRLTAKAVKPSSRHGFAGSSPGRKETALLISCSTRPCWASSRSDHYPLHCER
jgi:hypothetical protein